MPEEKESAAQLLVRAVNSLEPEERDKVLAWVFERIPSTSAASLAPAVQRGLAHRWGEFAAAEQSLIATWGLDPARKDMQMVPVRMPVELHAQLRDWCKEHNFSMATVIRGLLARFLDDQGKHPPKAVAAD